MASKLNVDEISDRTGSGAPNCPNSIGVNETNPLSSISGDSKSIHIKHNNLATVIIENTTVSAKYEVAAINADSLLISRNGVEIARFNTNGFSLNGGTDYLESYEDDTFLPSLTSAGGGTVTYTVRKGSYIKIGKRVIFNLELGISAFTGGSGGMIIGDLPYQVENDTNSYSSVSVRAYLLAFTGDAIQAYCDIGTSNIILENLNNNAVSTALAIDSSFTGLILSGSYQTA